MSIPPPPPAPHMPPLPPAAAARLAEFLDHLRTLSPSLVGYPCSQDYHYPEILPFLDFAINNIGFFPGGLGSLPGAVLGALILGDSEALISAYVSTAMRDLFAYILLILILLVRPSGLMGKSSEDKA